MLLLASGCEEDVNILDMTAKSTTVLYGLIDVNDSVTHIRITKTFTGNQNAYLIGKDTLLTKKLLTVRLVDFINNLV